LKEKEEELASRPLDDVVHSAEKTPLPAKVEQLESSEKLQQEMLHLMKQQMQMEEARAKREELKAIRAEEHRKRVEEARAQKELKKQENIEEARRLKEAADKKRAQKKARKPRPVPSNSVETTKFSHEQLQQLQSLLQVTTPLSEPGVMK
jgi:membrane protein involved in colicin uptake